jgi:hypothetical protein
MEGCKDCGCPKEVCCKMLVKEKLLKWLGELPKNKKKLNAIDFTLFFENLEKQEDTHD